jgi:hypothetical protein
LDAGTPDSVWPPLVASIAPIAVGAVSVHFKLFIESDGEFRRRISLHRQNLIEGFATKLAAVLHHARRMTADDVLRGDGREEPDLVGDVAKECYRLSCILHRMEFIRAFARIAYTILCVSIALGIFGVLLAWLEPAARPYVLWGAIALVVLQFGLVLCVMRASSAMEVYEDVS